MIELTYLNGVPDKNELKSVIAPHICGNFNILRTPNGKPYIDGDPLYFSLSHSKNVTVIAISDEPVGVDLEFTGRKKYSATLSRFTARERAKITDETDFLHAWVAKESFIKLIGGTLAHDLKRLEYYGGKIYCDGKPQPCKIRFEYPENGGICAICTGQRKIL